MICRLMRDLPHKLFAELAAEGEHPCIIWAGRKLTLHAAPLERMEVMQHAGRNNCGAYTGKHKSRAWIPLTTGSISLWGSQSIVYKEARCKRT